MKPILAFRLRVLRKLPQRSLFFTLFCHWFSCCLEVWCRSDVRNSHEADGNWAFCLRILQYCQKIEVLSPCWLHHTVRALPFCYASCLVKTDLKLQNCCNKFLYVAWPVNKKVSQRRCVSVCACVQEWRVWKRANFMSMSKPTDLKTGHERATSINEWNGEA